MNNKNQIHTKNKEYYTYFISNDIKEEINKYTGDEKNEKILENIPEDIIEQKTFKINNISKTKNFRNCKLHFTKNNNIVNLTYNGLVNNFSLNDINSIDNNSYVKNYVSFNVNNIIGLDKKDEEYNILQNIYYNNNVISNNINIYGQKDNSENNSYFYFYKKDLYYHIYRNVNIKLTYNNNQINLITDLLKDEVINDNYYVIYTINNEKYYYDFNNILKNINGGEDIIVSFINLSKQNNFYNGEIDFDNINDYVILSYYNISSETIPYNSLFKVDKINKTLIRINDEEVRLCINENSNEYLNYTYNYSNKILSTITSFDYTNKSIDDLYIWLINNIIYKDFVKRNINYEIMNDNYDDKLYSTSIYPPTGSFNYIDNNNYNIYNTLFPSIFKQLYYGRYFKQFSAIDPEDNTISITYKGISHIDIIEDTTKNNDDNNENEDNEENNDEETYEEDGINNEIKEYYEEEVNNDEEEIKPKIDDITDDNYYELITEIYRPKTIQKLLIPIQCLYSLTSIINTSNEQTHNPTEQIITELDFNKDVSNSKITINIPLDDINTININSTDIKIKQFYIPLLILPTGELILKFDELNINQKDYLNYGKSLPETTELTFNYENIWMLRKINIPSFSSTYNLILEQMKLKDNVDVLDTTDYNAEYYKHINNIDFSFYSKNILI